MAPKKHAIWAHFSRISSPNGVSQSHPMARCRYCLKEFRNGQPQRNMIPHIVECPSASQEVRSNAQALVKDNKSTESEDISTDQLFSGAIMTHDFSCQSVDFSQMDEENDMHNQGDSHLDSRSKNTDCEANSFLRRSEIGVETNQVNAEDGLHSHDNYHLDRSSKNANQETDADIVGYGSEYIHSSPKTDQDHLGEKSSLDIFANRKRIGTTTTHSPKKIRRRCSLTGAVTKPIAMKPAIVPAFLLDPNREVVEIPHEFPIWKKPPPGTRPSIRYADMYPPLDMEKIKEMIKNKQD